MKFKLTIVIATLNSQKFLRKTLSVLKKQVFKNFIIYVADGGSNDQTLELFKKSDLNYKIISKKDKSPEEAVNNCFKKIKTEYYSTLCSDDFYSNKFYLQNLLNSIENKNIDIVMPSMTYIYGNKKVYKPQGDDFKVINFQPIIPGFGWVAKKDISQFLFNTKYKMATDYEYLLRIYKKKYKFYRERGAVYCFRLGAKTYINYAKALEEFKEISLNFNGSKLLILYFYYKSKFKFMIKRLLRK